MRSLHVEVFAFAVDNHADEWYSSTTPMALSNGLVVI
jgi:hypothetical protein